MKKLPNRSESQTAGLILCGGQSRRMERDKGLIEEQGQSWAELAAAKLRPFIKKIYYSLREEQFGSYAKKIPDLKKENCIFDESIAAGPLRGILTAYRQLRTGLLVLPADMPALPKELIEKLLQESKKSGRGFGVACFVTPLARKEEEIHPFPSFWEEAFLEKIYKQVATGNLENFSIIRLVKQSEPLLFELPTKKRPFLQSKNRPQDL